MQVLRSKNQEQTAFGWKFSTHKEITKLMVIRFNPLLPKEGQFNYEILKYSCIEPDLSRKHVTKYIHGHFANVNKPSVDPPDGRQLLIKYTNAAIKMHKEGNYAKRDDYLGYALHFLQDILNPMHVIFKPLDKASKERIFHKKFEKLATEIQKTIFKTSNLTSLEDSDPFFEKILPKAMKKAKKQLKKIKNKKYDNINEIVAAALDNTYKTTAVYFRKLITEINKAA